MTDHEDDEEGRRLVAAAREQWIRRLIDNSRNNSLLFYRELKVGTLDLTEQTAAVDALLQGRHVDLSSLQPPQDAPERQRLVHRLTAIQRKARENEEEKGLETLVLALGRASWPAADGGRPHDAPVLLLPVRIRSRGSSREDLRLETPGEPKVNLVLLHVLAHEFGVAVDAERLLAAGAKEREDGGWMVDPEAAQRQLSLDAHEIDRFEVSHRAVLGNFAFARMAMVEDLLRHGEALGESCLIRALAGHGPSRRALQAERVAVDPKDLDRIAPEDEHVVLDADSSQQRAIVMAALGQDGVIHGPPGTGKSQTIANLIAELVAQGKRVLFVAEKRAALEAVLKRLRGVGLGHLALDLHGATVSRKDVMAHVKEALERVHESMPVDCADLHADFTERRRALNEHARRMNEPRSPTALSVHRMEGALMRLPAAARSTLRWRHGALTELTPERSRQVRSALVEATSLPGLFLGTDKGPWNDARIADGRAAQDAVDLVASLVDGSWPRFETALAALVTEARLESVTTLEACHELASVTRAIESLFESHDARLFQADPSKLAAALDAAARGPLATAWAFVTDRRFRAARRTLLGSRRAPAASRFLQAEARAAALLETRWRALAGSGSRPAAFASAGAFRNALQSMTASLQPLIALLDWKRVGSDHLDSLRKLLSELRADGTTPYKMPRVHELRTQLAAAGVSSLVDDLRQHDVEPPLWTQRFEHAWLASALDRAKAEDPQLATFDGRTHDACVEDFARLDRGRLVAAASRVRRLHAQGAVEAMNAHPDQADLVKREAHKRARHISLRRLLSEAPDVLTRVAPCWVASPLSVSQLLGGGARLFDVAIFDEASQILPEEAIASLSRAGQAVVAGDRHQLPPTTFFATSTDDDVDEAQESEEPLAGFESLLDSTAAFLPTWALDWHYRSDDERLIAFSNHHIYDDRLVTFPSARIDDVVRHVLVPHDPGLAAQDVSASPEVDEVVRLVMEHVAQKPHESLGVIAMGIRHANRIQEALDRELRLRGGDDEFFDIEKEERFFVKNLENVQGDERDAILLSVGYGKTADGDLPHRFGPLTQATGHRRLNVAVTRARRRLTLVSSFSHHEVDLERSRSRGVQLLKAYLEYAASGGARLPRTPDTDVAPDNAFEVDIKDALEARGLRLRAQHGASRYRIDLVAMHPTIPGRAVLAIECDGASYHASATARDRDRLRQQQLMRLGWRFHRIWSTDWFTRREAEIERAMRALQEAVADIDLSDDISDAERAISHRDGAVRETASLRGRCPVPRRGSVDAYSDPELARMARWVRSDGRLRTDEEMVREMQGGLGIPRLGSRIRERLERAIAATRHPD